MIKRSTYGRPSSSWFPSRFENWGLRLRLRIWRRNRERLLSSHWSREMSHSCPLISYLKSPLALKSWICKKMLPKSDLEFCREETGNQVTEKDTRRRCRQRASHSCLIHLTRMLSPPNQWHQINMDNANNSKTVFPVLSSFFSEKLMRVWIETKEKDRLYSFSSPSSSLDTQIEIQTAEDFHTDCLHFHVPRVVWCTFWIFHHLVFKHLLWPIYV